MEAETDSEHEQDDSYLGELIRKIPMRDEPWREGTHDDTSREVPYDRRKSKFLRRESEHEGRGESTGESEDKIHV